MTISYQRRLIKLYSRQTSLNFSGKYAEYVKISTLLLFLVSTTTPVELVFGPKDLREAAMHALVIQYLSFNITERIIICMLQY